MTTCERAPGKNSFPRYTIGDRMHSPRARVANGRNQPTSSAVSPVPAPEVVPPPPAVEQKPPQPPTVAWDCKQLTIDAENSTLAAVLLAVRDRTGAAIEIPGGAYGERVFLHLGPGPAREILSSLLYGTSFDYIIEAADDDPDTLRRVVLTARGLGEGSGDVVVAGATNTVEGSGGRGSTPAAVAHRGEATEGRGRRREDDAGVGRARKADLPG